MFGKIFLFVCVAVACDAQIWFPGYCPAVNVKQNFVASLYLGKWYEAEKYCHLPEVLGKCITATYTATVSPDSVGVTNRQLTILTNSQSSITGTATFIGQPNDARLSVVFPGIPAVASYWVLETDYTNYAVVYSCKNGLATNRQTVWILTRARYPSLTVMQKAYDVMDNNGLSRAFLLRTDQNNCPVGH